MSTFQRQQRISSTSHQLPSNCWFSERQTGSCLGYPTCDSGKFTVAVCGIIIQIQCFYIFCASTKTCVVFNVLFQTTWFHLEMTSLWRHTAWTHSRVVADFVFQIPKGLTRGRDNTFKKASYSRHQLCGIWKSSWEIKANAANRRQPLNPLTHYLHVKPVPYHVLLCFAGKHSHHFLCYSCSSTSG